MSCAVGSERLGLDGVRRRLGLRAQGVGLRCRTDARERVQPPHDDADRHDGGAGGPQKRETLVLRSDEGISQRRRLVRRQLENHRPRLTAQQGAAKQQRAPECGGRTERVAGRERETREERLSGKQERREQHVHGKPRRATHERRDQDRRKAIPAIGNQSRGHDARKRARVRRQQRHERVTRQPETAQQPVHHEGRARKIARVLEQADQEEQQADLRQEDDRAGDAADDSLRDEIVHEAFRNHPARDLAEPGERRLDQIHRQGRERKERVEQPDHHAGKKQQTEHGMRERLVETLGQRVAAGSHRRRAAHAVFHDVFGPGRQIARHLSVPSERRPHAPRFLQQRFPSDARIPSRPDASSRHDRHDRTAEVRAQLRRVEAQAALLRQVNHVQRDDDGESVREKLAGENQIPREVARIDDDDHGVRLGVGAAAGQHVTRDASFRKIEAEPVETRQIDDVHDDVAADNRAADSARSSSCLESSTSWRAFRRVG